MTTPGRISTFGSASSGSAAATAASDESSTAAIVHILTERLRAWKHVAADFEKYTNLLIKIYHSRGKEYESDIVNLLSRPLREGTHFSTTPGGIVELFESMRDNSQRIVNEQNETSRALKATVLPIFERLHAEVKKKTDDLDDGITKSFKIVDKSRKETQKQIELLGRQVASFDTNTSPSATASSVKVPADDDPYILNRHVRNRLFKLITEQNNHRKDLLGVQNNLAEFESYVVKTMRSGIEELTTVCANEAAAGTVHFRNITATAAGMQPNFEWSGFVQREGPTGSNILVHPDEPAETLDTFEFANMSHRSTLPVLAGALERQAVSKRTMGFSKKFAPAYVVITPSGYLHQFAPDEVTATSNTSGPSAAGPELSLYLPDCTVPVDTPGPDLFSVQGKDTSKRLGGIKLSGFITHDLVFRASSAAEAAKWLRVTRAVAKGELNDMMAKLTMSPSNSGSEKAGPASPAAAAVPVPAAKTAAEMAEKGSAPHHIMTAAPPAVDSPPAYDNTPSPTRTTGAIGGPAPATSSSTPPPPAPGSVPVPAQVPATTTASAGVPPGPPSPAPGAVPAVSPTATGSISPVHTSAVAGGAPAPAPTSAIPSPHPPATTAAAGAPVPTATATATAPPPAPTDPALTAAQLATRTANP